MKGIVVYDSSHGNTKKIAETIAETLKESGLEVDNFYVKDLKKLSAKDYDFMVLGSPTACLAPRRTDANPAPCHSRACRRAPRGSAPR